MTAGQGSPRAGFLRVNGILVMVLLVASGFGVGAAYYSYKEPRVRRELEAELAAAPSTAEGRVQKWMEFFLPQAHHRLSTFARVSDEHPWIVTHTVEAQDGGEPLVHGIDVSALPQEGLLVREGLTVVLTLDPVRLLGRARLGGDSAAHIPHHAADIPAAEADARLRETAEWLLKDVEKALESDIPGALFEVRTRGGGGGG